MYVFSDENLTLFFPFVLAAPAFTGRMIAFDNEKNRFGWKHSTCESSEDFPPNFLKESNGEGMLAVGEPDNTESDYPLLDEPKGTKRSRSP